MNDTPQLPAKLSELLRLAVDDAEKCDSDPRYRLVMSVWHEPPRSGRPKCSVCMAGAVLAKTLKRPIDELVDSPDELDEYDGDTIARLFAIDCMRFGDFQTAVEFAEQRQLKDSDKVLVEIGQAVYDAFDEDTRRAPWEVYRSVADRLEAEGY